MGYEGLPGPTGSAGQLQKEIINNIAGSCFAVSYKVHNFLFSFSGLAGTSGQKGERGTLIYPADSQAEGGDYGFPGVPGWPGERGQMGREGPPGRQGFPGFKGQKVKGMV